MANRFERVVRQFRSWRASSPTQSLGLGPSLPESDFRRLRSAIDTCLEARGGETAARRAAASIGSDYLLLNSTGRRRFLRLLAEEYGHDHAEVDLAIDGVLRAKEPTDRSEAEKTLALALKSRRIRLLRRFIGIDGGLSFLVDMREDLLPLRRQAETYRSLDGDLKSLLESWFDVGLLELTQLTWDTPASLLEKLIEYEAVHAIESWDDLRGRLGGGRRCYAFVHPAMPGEPLIFVEIALTQGISSELPPLLDHSNDRIDPDDADTAIFYSISNCHPGLAGVSLGDSLIKTVVGELSKDLPSLTTFSTLSPIPGFRGWLEERLTSGLELTESEIDQLTDAKTQLKDVVLAEAPPPEEVLEAARPALTRLVAEYLITAKRGRRATDPVANFHLSNGARVERINWGANNRSTGWSRSLGFMVNYRYVIDRIEDNHFRYASEGEIAATDEVLRLLGDPSE